MGRKLWFPVVSGSLAPFAAGFASWMTSHSYSPSAAAGRLCQFDQLSRWLEREGLGVWELTGGQAERFIAARRAAGRVTWVAPQSVMLPLGYLRELGVIPMPAPAVAQGSLEELLEDYRRYLLIERAAFGEDRGQLCAGGAAVPGSARGPGRAGAGAAVRGGCELVLGARVPEAQRVRRAGSGLRAAVLSAVPAPGRLDQRAVGVGGPLDRRSAGSHAPARAGARGDEEAVG